MKQTGNLRNAGLLKRIARSIYTFEDMTVIEIFKNNKYAYYVTAEDKPLACFAFCSDEAQEVTRLHDEGVFEEQRKKII